MDGESSVPYSEYGFVGRLREEYASLLKSRDQATRLCNSEAGLMLERYAYVILKSSELVALFYHLNTCR